MAPTPELIDDITAEIFLRLPPNEPEHLFRASLVCKPWFRVVSDPGFLRRYRAFHRTPPLLGFLKRQGMLHGPPARCFTPTTKVPLTPNLSFPNFEAFDCRHGRVLLHAEAADKDLCFMVWDPLTGDKQRVPDVDFTCQLCTAAVSCDVDGCDHLDCHGGPFRVVLMATDASDYLVKATFYSSATGAWSTPVSLSTDCEVYAQHRQDSIEERGYYSPMIMPRRGSVVGDEAYCALVRNAIVRYNWSKNCISMINPPLRNLYKIALMEMEDSALGFVCIEDWSLCLWSRKVSAEAAAEWVKCRVIELKGLIPVADNPSAEPLVVGSAEGVGVIFVTTGYSDLFTLELESRQVRKVEVPDVFFSIIPYMSFYTPDYGKLSSPARTH